MRHPSRVSGSGQHSSVHPFQAQYPLTRRLVRAKGTVFFFSPEKFAPHSLTRFLGNCFFFVFHVLEKKTPVFFSAEKFAGHSLAKKNDISKKRSKNVKKREFLHFFKFLRCFFFLPQIVFFSLVFFFLEKFTPHSLTRFQRAGKKKQAGKKKHHFHSLTRFLPKSGKK